MFTCAGMKNGSEEHVHGCRRRATRERRSADEQTRWREKRPGSSATASGWAVWFSRCRKSLKSSAVMLLLHPHRTKDPGILSRTRSRIPGLLRAESSTHAPGCSSSDWSSLRFSGTKLVLLQLTGSHVVPRRTFLEKEPNELQHTPRKMADWEATTLSFGWARLVWAELGWLNLAWFAYQAAAAVSQTGMNSQARLRGTFSHLSRVRDTDHQAFTVVTPTQ